MGAKRLWAVAMLAVALLGGGVRANAGGYRAALPPDAVLERYAAALDAVSPPPAMIFEYTVEQAGLHNLDQSHRIYRHAQTERDETLAVDGARLSPPSVRILRDQTDRYDILSVAPRPGKMIFTFLGAERQGGGYQYVFRTMSKAAVKAGSQLLVDRISISDESFLPTTVEFHLAGAAVRAQGRLTYARWERYWLVREAFVSAVVGEVPVRERILWTSYQFPKSLPASTFARLLPDVVEGHVQMAGS